MVKQEAYNRGFNIINNAKAVALINQPTFGDGTPFAVRLEDDSVLSFDILLIATGAAALPLLRNNTDLLTDTNGYLRIRSTLQSSVYDNVFACGDCSSMDEFNGEFPPKVCNKQLRNILVV